MRLRAVRLLASAWLSAAVLRAGLEFRLFDTKEALGEQYDVGTAAAGDRIDTRLLLWNSGSESMTIGTLTVSGSAFILQGAPALPATLPPQQGLAFTVRFAPSAAGMFSAGLRAETAVVILRGSAIPAVSILVDQDGTPRLLPAEAVLDFGVIERGSPASRRVILENRNSQPIAGTVVTIAGRGFRLEGASAAASVMAPGDALVLAVVFDPPAAGTWEGSLRIGSRLIAVRGAAREPELPSPVIEVDRKRAASGEQVRVAVRLSTVSRGRGSGTLRVELEPAAAGFPPDPAVVFSTGARSATFVIMEGDGAGRFGTEDAIAVQTGTTAGTLLFTVELGKSGAELRLPIAAEPARLQAAHAIRRGGQLEVRVTGFDNARSISRLAFSFFERDGKAVPPAPLLVDAAADFRRYFETSQMGGAFVLSALFPVSGDAARVASVELEITNAAGVTHSPRMPF